MSQERAEWAGTGRDRRGRGGMTTPKHSGRLRGKGAILLGVSHRPARVRFPPPPHSEAQQSQGIAGLFLYPRFRMKRWSLHGGKRRPFLRMGPVPSWWASRGSARSSAAPVPSSCGKHRGPVLSPSGTSPSRCASRRGPEHGQREPCRVSRGCAPADLREALVGPFERVQVGGVVQVEWRLGELHDPPTRRGTP